MRYIIAVIGGLIATAAVLLYPPILSWAAAAGQVESVNGQAWDIRGKQTFQLTSGSVVKPEDIIWTGKKGQARLVMSDDSVVVLGPRSRIRIDRYDMDQQGLVAGAFYLLWGKARFLVTKLNNTSDSFSVSTQTAIIGVRGTEFGVIVPLPTEIGERGEAPYTDAMLFKGKIVGMGLKGGTVIMKPGQFTHFTVDQPPQERQMIAQDIQRLDIPQLAQGLIEPNPIQLQEQSVNPGDEQNEAPGLTGRPVIPHSSEADIAHPEHPEHPEIQMNLPHPEIPMNLPHPEIPSHPHPHPTHP